ncbi:cortical patch protein, variant, partial [Magnaporthiopsis poae ATCC 64411]
MAVSHASLGLAAVALLGGSLAMLFFIVLAGVTDAAPLNNAYFLEASTAGIAGARPVSRWTYFYICGPGNLDCTVPRPAPGVGWAWASGGAGAPAELVGPWHDGTTSEYYWYMWRFGWVLFLIALFFEVLAFFASFIACLGRLGSAVAGLVSMTALFFLTIAVALMTATFVKMRDSFLAA